MNKLIGKGYTLSTLVGIALILFCTSCMHKDVMTDRADDVISTLIYKGKEGNFIICKEAVFQANSKSSGRGFTRISGYNDFRISTYDLATGKLITRINMKHGLQDGEFTIMGATEGKLWMYSANKDLGLHYRNPKTLEVIANQQKLTETTPLKNISLAPAPWSRIDTYYSFDWGNGQPIITDAQGYVYHLNPDTFTAEKLDEKLKTRFSVDWFTNSINIDENRRLYLAGDNRSTIQIGNKQGDNDKLSFLFGKFILDNSDVAAGIVKKRKIEEYQKIIAESEDSIKAYKSTHKTDNSHDYYRGDLSNAETDKYEMNEKHRTALEHAKMDLQHLMTFGIDLKNPISNEPMTFLVYYANSITDTARAIISKVKFNADSSTTEVWKCELNSFFFDPDKASKKGSFDIVFSKGNPQFRYQWFDVDDNKLIMISQLQMACIDMNTGKVLWEINI